jgi:signal transduction histidine kinase
MSRRPAAPSEAERGRSALSSAILAFRWVTLAWLSLVALGSDLERPLAAAAAIVVTVAWTVWLTVARPGRSRAVLAIDLALAVALNLLSGWVVPTGQVVGDHPFFASAYPVAADAYWGATLGFRGGLAAGTVVGLSLAGSRLVNGTGIAGESVPQLLHLASGMLNHVIAGGAVGLVAELLDRSAAQLRQAGEEAMAARERAARLAERESLARQIHDSILQALALVHKRGRELAAGGAVPAAEVARLAEMAGDQEEALRTLILREPREWPTGTASLRAELEALTRAGSPVPVTVSATGPITLPVRHVDELAAAVRQALDNVAEHARASKVSLFADADEDAVVVAVRDDGVGFDYDEPSLAAQGKIGLLKSMKGRVEGLGGTMRVDSRPGVGTEVEFRVPAARSR